MSSEFTQLHYAEVLRSHNLAAQAKLVFYFGLAKDNVCGDVLIQYIQLRVFYINEHYFHFDDGVLLIAIFGLRYPCCFIAGTNKIRSLQSQFAGLITPDRTGSTEVLKLLFICQQTDSIMLRVVSSILYTIFT